MKKLTDEEINKLVPVLEKIESDVLLSYGLHKISGSFSKAEMFNYDDDIIDVQLTTGIQSDVENSRDIENVKVDRKTFEIID